MSAVVAVLRPSGRVAGGEVDLLFSELADRGHDGTGAVVDGPVGLGVQQFHTLPADRVADQPVTGGDVTLVVDGRVDNRPALAAALGPDAVETASDAEVVLAAYREWGLDCLDRLVGPLALALWDADRRRLVCARDETGLRHLYYANVDGALLVASEASALLAHPDVSAAVDEAALGRLLAGNPSPSAETVYEDVRKLDHGTYLSASSGGAAGSPEVARYWRPTDDVRPELRDPATRRAELRSLLETAVACRLDAPGTPGVMTSGGLDSPSVATVAGELVAPDTVDAFSMVFDDLRDVGLAAERRRIRAFDAATDVAVHEVPVDEHWPLRSGDADADRLLDCPVADPLRPAAAALYDRALRRGRVTLLTGVGADLLAGSRFAFHDLLAEGRLGTLARRLAADPAPVRRLLAWWVLAPAVPGPALRVSNRLSAREGPEPPDVLADAFRERLESRGALSLDSALSFDRLEMDETYWDLHSAENDAKMAAYRQAALRAGVDLRHPFLDARFVDFVFSLPTASRLRGRQSKRPLRSAMEGRLPEELRTTVGGGGFDPFVDDALRNREADTVRSLLSDSRLVEAGYVSEEGLWAAADRFFDGAPARVDLWRLVSAERWLRAVEGLDDGVAAEADVAAEAGE